LLTSTPPLEGPLRWTVHCRCWPRFALVTVHWPWQSWQRAPQLYKSTTLRLLASLVHARLLQRRDDGRYTLGVEVARLNGVFQRQFSLADVVLPVLRQLVTTTGESAAYHVLQGQPPHASRLCLYRVDSPHPVRDHIQAGDVLPADRGAGALVLMAFTPHASSDDGIFELRNDPVSVRIRAAGYFCGVGQRLPDVAGVSAPVFGADGRIAGALTLSLPAHRYDTPARCPCGDCRTGVDRQDDRSLMT
jgi:DNA-binding IclR family transcriptional regulator